MKLHICCDLSGNEEVRAKLVRRLGKVMEAAVAELGDVANDADVPEDVEALADLIGAVEGADVVPDGLFAAVAFCAGPDREMVCDATTLGENGMFALNQARRAGAEGDVVRMAAVLHFGSRAETVRPRANKIGMGVTMRPAGPTLTATCEIAESDDDLPYA